MTKRAQVNRRELLKTLAFAGAVTVCVGAHAEDPVLHGPLPAWSEGHFDMHHIDTGRGNCTLLIFPDSTTMMIDAGAASDIVAGSLSPARPDASRRPGEWMARYALAHAPVPRLDYFLATHIHPDHVSGLADVAAALPVGICIDRGFPHYAASQQPLAAPFADEYLSLLKERVLTRRPVEAAKVGSSTQIVQRHAPARYGNFSAQILAANGAVWSATKRAPEAKLTAAMRGSENTFSVATRFRYGAFSYFTGGDLTADTQDGRYPALDVESPVARAAGRTEVAVADHHGYFDACGAEFVQALDAQAYIIPSWDVGHPGSAQMQRMLGAWDGKAQHDVFALNLHPGNALSNRRFTPMLKSQQGHVVVRVAPGGGQYSIFAVDSRVERGNITGIFGPYMSRG